MRLGFPKSGRQTGARARWLLAIAAFLLVAISAPGPRLGAKGQAQSASMRSRSVSSLPFATADGSGAMLLELFPDTVLTVDRDRVERTGPRRVVWRGHVRGLDDASVVTLATVDGVTVGEITVQDDRYRIRPRPDGYVIEQLAPAAYRPELPPLDPGPSELGLQRADVVAQDDGSIVDVMIVYTPAAAAAAGGPAAIQATIDAAVSNANNAYANSGVIQRLRLVYSGQIQYTESGSVNTDLSRLRGNGDGFMDGVHSIRDSVGADDVSLFEQTSEACGIGYLMTSVSTGFASSAFNVTAWDCAAGNLSYAHEAGHNFGLHHDVDNAGGGVGAFPYAYGYRVPGSFRTVMSYQCEFQGLPGCPRVQLFSTPSRTFNGVPAGVADQAETVRALNNTRTTTANFRASVQPCSFSISPTSISVPSGGGSFSLTVTAGGGCSWIAVSNATFLTVNAGSPGSGSGSVTFGVAANASASQRTGTLTVAGQTFTVVQARSVTAPSAPTGLRVIR